MSVLRYREGMNSTDIQIWDNAAFDNGESEDSSAILKSSWSNSKPEFMSSTESLNSFSSKENQNPLFENNSLSVKSSAPLKLIHQNGVIEKSRINPIKANSKLGFVEKSILKSVNEGEIRDDKKIDQEIEEIEKEISRLSSRLEALKVEKAEKIVETVEKRGRVIPAKFMEKKQSDKDAEEKKKIESLSISAKSKVQRRGLSMGPSEIVGGARRGMSLGPAEILASAAKSRQIGKQDSAIITTPIQSTQNRRKSCFWKLQNIDELKVTKERRKSLSLSPKSRKANNAKIHQSSRQAATTVASRKILKKEDAIINSIQPKKLFKDVEKSAAAATTNKKPMRPGKVVASRYNQSSNQALLAMRKRSLPENDQDESKRYDKKRSLSPGKSRPTQPEIKNLGTEGRVKKRWEIPNEIVVHRSSESESSSPPTISLVPDLLPRIRTAGGGCRRLIETPRDSGPAKRVADLIGKKSYFSIDEEVESSSSSFCQALNFQEDDKVEEI